MDISFFTSALSETDYRIFSITSAIITSSLKGYVFIALTIYFLIELIKMMYLRQPMDIPNLLIAGLIATSLTVYSDVAKGFDMEMNDIYSSIKKTSGNVNVALKQGTFKGTVYEAEIDSQLKAYSSDDDKVNMFDEFFTGNMSSVIYLIMSGIRKTILLFLYGIGPVVMVLSMFPIFGIKVLKNWFFYLLGVHMWELCFIILQIIQSQIGFWSMVDANTSDSVGSLVGNGWALFCYNFVVAICFFMVPYLTSKMLMGLTQASSFGGKVMAMAAVAGRVGVGSATKGGNIVSNIRSGSSGGGGGGVKDMLSQGDLDKNGGSGGIAGKAGKLYGNVVKNFKGPPTT